MYSFILILFLITLYSIIHYRTINLKVDTLSFKKTLPSRGILALLVIFCHLSYQVNTPPQSLFVPMGTMAVGVFFLMSGYGLECSYRRKGDGYLDGFLRKRLWKLLLPYLIVIVAWNIEECFLYPDENLIDAWRQIKTGVTNGILPYSWYVIAAIWFYVAFYLSHRCTVSEKKRFLVIAIFWAAWFLGCHFLHWGTWWYRTSHMFLVGILYCKTESFIKRCNVYAWVLVTLLLAVMGTITEFHIFTTMLFYTAFSLLFVCGVTLCEYRSKVMDFLGKISYELYIVQALPLFALKDSGLHPALIVVLCVSIDLALAYLLHLSVKKVLGNVSK